MGFAVGGSASAGAAAPTGRADAVHVGHLACDGATLDGAPIVSPKPTTSVVQVASGLSPTSQPSTYFVVYSGNVEIDDNGLLLNYKLVDPATSVCVGLNDGTIRTLAVLPGVGGDIHRAQSLAVVPPGYANSGTMYVSSDKGLYAVGPDGTQLWNLPGENRAVVGVVPNGVAGAGGVLVWAGDLGTAALAPDGSTVRDPGNANAYAPKFVTQIPDGAPGAGNVVALLADGSGTASFETVTPEGQVRTMVPPKQLRNAINVGAPIMAAPAGTPVAGSVWGITVEGDRCYAYRIAPGGKIAGTYEVHGHAKGHPEVTYCPEQLTSTISIGRAGTKYAGTLFFKGDGNVGNYQGRLVAVSPNGTVRTVDLGKMSSPKAREIVGLWTVPAPQGGLVVQTAAGTKVIPDSKLKFRNP